MASNSLYYLKRVLYNGIKKSIEVVGGTPKFYLTIDEIYFRPFSRQIARLQANIGFDCAIATYVFFSSALLPLLDHVYKIIDAHDSFREMVVRMLKPKAS